MSAGRTRSRKVVISHNPSGRCWVLMRSSLKYWWQGVDYAALCIFDESISERAGRGLVARRRFGIFHWFRRNAQLIDELCHIFTRSTVVARVSAAADRPARRRGSAHAKYSASHRMVIKPCISSNRPSCWIQISTVGVINCCPTTIRSSWHSLAN